MKKSSLRGLLARVRANVGQVPRGCACTNPGPFRCPVPGILLGLRQKNSHRYVERCDGCETFRNDEVAGLVYALVHGGSCHYDRDLRVVWKPK